MRKFTAQVSVVWQDFSHSSHDQIITVEVEAEDEKNARTLAYAEGQEWLKMTDYPGGCEVRSLVEIKPNETQ